MAIDFETMIETQRPGASVRLIKGLAGVVIADPERSSANQAVKRAGHGDSWTGSTEPRKCFVDGGDPGRSGLITTPRREKCDRDPPHQEAGSGAPGVSVRCLLALWMLYGY